MAVDATALGDRAADYTARGAAFRTSETQLVREAERISQLRLGAFAIAAAGGIALIGGWGSRPVALVAFLAGAVAYVIAARRHAARRRAGAWSGVRRRVCEQGAARVARDWNGLAETTIEPAPRDHQFAVDLDITGHASLARLVDVTSAGPGRRTLLSWLMGEPASPREIRDRQDAVRELGPAVEWRETLTAHAWSDSRRTPRRTDVERFLQWAERAPWLVERRWIVWASRVLPFVIAPTATLALLGVLWTRRLVPPPGAALVSIAASAGRWWAFPFIGGLLLTAMTRREVTERLQAAMSHLSGLSAYAAMLAHVESGSFAAPRLANLRSRLATGRGAARELMRLGSVVRLAEVRYSPMGHAVLQVLGLWDLHVLAALERWQVDSGTHARDWLAALGDAEALSALGTLAYDNPAWTFPELAEGPPRIEATALGHPLLSATHGVSNDVTVGPPGTFLLVTGSNMSGKSTLLRAIGTNVVLAQAGGPVCAESMRLTPVELWTSIRIDDSLEAGVSLFMAELRRLKRIVDEARDPERSRPLLYLLDEILHGTNTAERRVAARRVLTALINAGAIGAATTHDLTLADDPALDRAAERVHFTERFERKDGAMTMTFDYRLRPGLATSANALKLLEMIGLGDETG